MEHRLITSLKDSPDTCLLVGVCKDGSLPALPVSAETQNLMAILQKQIPETHDIVWQANHLGQAFAMIQCGDIQQYTPRILDKSLLRITKELNQRHITSAMIALPPLPGYEPDWQLEYMVLKLDAYGYQFLQFKTQQKLVNTLHNVNWYLPNASADTLATVQPIAQSIRYTRDLANLPANICTPTYLAKQAHELDQQWDSITAKALDKQSMANLNMGALLAVAQGSAQPPHLIVVKYNSHLNTQPVVLVGKGITFDSGGISLKPADKMEEMKYDMSGAATVLGVIKACAHLKLPIHVIGILACAENMPSGSAVKPGDVVTSMSGQTIEIINTDAEGRLVLADALTYAKQFNPQYVIDIATLTGAIIVALGYVNSGLMSNDDTLANLLLKASEQSQDKIWRMPLDSIYQEMLNSPVADVMNSTGDRAAGSITAACFLSRFTESMPWAHLDIAGTAWISGKERCATGRPVALLIQFLRNLLQP